MLSERIKKGGKNVKKKQTIRVSVLLACILLLAASAVTIFWFINKSVMKEEVNYELFSAFTEVEEFQSIPAMNGKNIKIGSVIDYGSQNYLLDVNGSTVEEYKNYLDILISSGFQKHSDNGEEAMEGNVYTSAFQKENLTVVISHIIMANKTYISAGYDKELSEHMIFKDEYVADANIKPATKLHMLELNNFGASFVIELKNGHFVIQDGGQDVDAPYLLDYLEQLTPGDEKPVVEGWFISHPHGDHYGALHKIANTPTYKNRIYVNEVYFHRPPDAFMVDPDPEIHLDPMFSDMVEDLHYLLTAEGGEPAKGYRPQIGQRYYFCDIYIDVVMTTEQLLVEQKRGHDVNDTSTWLMTHVEGQRILIGGDAGYTSTSALVNLYSPEYLDVDIFAVLHHGINVYDYFTDYINFDTALYPIFRKGSAYSLKASGTLGTRFARVEENERLVAKAKDVYSYEDGSVVLTFPYVVGTAEITEPCDWRYTPSKTQARYTSGWGWDEGDL